MTEYTAITTSLLLVKLAVVNARPDHLERKPRWLCVSTAFGGLEQSLAVELCRLAGVDPNEILAGTKASE